MFRLGLAPWMWMWILAAAVFAALKGLTCHRVRATAAPWWKRLGYLAAWPGLDPASFLGLPARSRPDVREWTMGAANAALGLALLLAAPAIVPAGRPYLLGWIGMIGIVLLLHFGFFRLLSCAWRRAGVNARPLMDRPLASASLSEFWGRRWNTAFRDVTHELLFRPLAGRFGAPAAITAAFAFSGLLHDLVISVPAGAGYGGPTAFFLVQAAGMLFERSTAGRRLGLGAGPAGRAFTIAVLLVPLYWLFHPPFVERVAAPFVLALH